MADELKPCRKCGSANHKIDQFSVNQNRFVRECRDCDYVTATYETQAEANAAWNTRQPEVVGEPVAWLYTLANQSVTLREKLHRDGVLRSQTGWTETPLYARPDPALADLRAELDRWKGFRNETERQYQEKVLEVIALDDQIATLRAKGDALAEAVKAAIEEIDVAAEFEARDILICALSQWKDQNNDRC